MQRTVEHKVKAKITYARYGEVFFVSTFHQFDVEYVLWYSSCFPYKMLGA